MTKTEIEKIIPHSGKMCLIDEVLSWNQNSIDCSSFSHQDKNHPLRQVSGTLNSLHALEYGAQAAAIHHVLIQKQGKILPSKGGVVVKFRSVKLFCEDLSDYQSALMIQAKQVMSNEQIIIYDIKIFHCYNEKLLVSACLTIVIET